MKENSKTLKDKLFFGLNGFPDQMTYQAFTNRYCIDVGCLLLLGPVERLQ